MKFLWLEMQNFLGFKEKTRIQLAEQGAVLLVGRNGAGKSTIPGGFSWALFGKTIKGLSGDEVVHRFADKDCYVTVHFKDDDGALYKVTRYRKHTEHKNALEFYIGGTRLTLGSVDETQAEIDRVLGINYKAFVGVMCGQGVSEPFSKLTDAQAKAIFDKVVGLEWCNDALKAAKEEAVKAQDKITTTRSALTFAEGRRDDIRKSLKDLLEKSREVKDEAISKSESELKELRKRRAEFVTKEAEAVSLRARLSGKVAAIQKAREALQVQANAFALEIKSKETHLLNLERIAKKGSCFVCGTEVDDPAATKAQIAETRDLIETLEKQHEEVNDGAKLLEVKRKDVAFTDVPSYTLSIKEVDREIEKRLKAEPSKLESGFDSLVGEARTKLKKVKAEIAKWEEDLKQLDHQRGLYEFWVEGFGNRGLKSLMLDSVVPFLNEKANHYSNLLTDSRLKVSFDTTSKLARGAMAERFKVNVTYVDGADSYAGASGGEEACVDLCVAKAFQALLVARSKCRMNVVFHDEPFDALDDVAIEKAVSLIADDLEGYESVFVITHRTDLKDYFSNHMEIEKHGSQSVLV